MRAIWDTLCELAPWLLFGSLLSAILHVALPSGFIRRGLSGTWGVVKAVAIGVPLPLCSCGVIPAGIGLKKDGASDGAVVGFLISTPQTGVDSILVSAAVLGWPFAAFKVLTATVTGLVGGWITNVVSPVDASFNPTAGPSSVEETRRDLRGGLSHALDILRSIWKWLILGILISVVIELFLPASYLRAVGDWGILPASLLTLAISLPMYVCATASVPIAGQLVASGLPVGAALVFLIAGPATNAATVGAIYGRFGWKVLTTYLSTIVVGSLAFAIAFDYLAQSDFIRLAEAHHNHQTWWHQISGVVLSALLLWFAFDELRTGWRRRNSQRAFSRRLRIAVGGMTCANCSNRLESVLLRTDGVRQARVSLDAAEAIVDGEFDESGVRSAIETAGFQAGPAVSERACELSLRT